MEKRVAKRGGNGDEVGNRTKLAAQVGGHDFINTYAYDNLYRTTRIQQTSHLSGNAVADKRIDFGYDDASQLVSLSLFASPMGTDRVAGSDYTYDLLGRLTSLVHRKDSGESPIVTKSVEYRYDAFNRWVKRSEDADGDSVGTPRP